MAVMHHIDGPQVLKQFSTNPTKLKWVHNLFTGSDSFCKVKEFVDAHITFTNARGGSNQALSEYVLFSILYFAKKAPVFLKNKQNKVW